MKNQSAKAQILKAIKEPYSASLNSLGFIYNSTSGVAFETVKKALARMVASGLVDTSIGNDGATLYNLRAE